MPAQHLFRFFVVFFMLLGSLLWWPGEAVAESVIKTNPSAVDQFGRPILTSEQVLQAVLRVAEAVPKRQQLTPEMVKEVGGIQLKPWQKNPKWYDAAGQTTAPEWFYGFSLFPDDAPNGSAKGSIFQFSFSERPGLVAKDLSFDPICRPTLGDVDRALLKAGYTRLGRLSGRDIRYQHGDIFIRVLNVIGSKAYCVRYLRLHLSPPISKENSDE